MEFFQSSKFTKKNFNIWKTKVYLIFNLSFYLFFIIDPDGKTFKLHFGMIGMLYLSKF